VRRDLEAFFRSNKELAISPDWVIRYSEGLGFCCPIDVDGVTIDGYQRRAKAMLRTPDRQIVLQLEHHRRRISRLDHLGRSFDFCFANMTLDLKT